MKTPTKILVATDLGAAGDQAIETGAEWAKRYGARLTVAHVARDERAHDEAKGRLATRVKNPGADLRVVSGDKAECILDLARDTSADLIVLGGRELSGMRWMFGAVAEKILIAANVPVLFARPTRPGAILAATDLSEPSLPAVRAAREVASRTGARIVIAHAVERASGFDTLGMLSNPSGVDREHVEAARNKLAEMCELPPDDDSTEILFGAPGPEIVRFAEELPASLVVVASHGHTGFKRLLVGSVAAHVAREAHCSVLIVRLAAA